jgi:NAD(P) transhydrogenase subunit alpha
VSQTLFFDLSIFVLSLLVGIEVISKVPVTLHTPLMSGANAIHGIVVVGAMLVTAAADTWWAYLAGFVACAFAAANAVGGYLVTDRMLEMFRPRRVLESPQKEPVR